MNSLDDSEKRIKILIIAMVLFVIGLCLKLFQISIIQHPYYTAMAENQYIYTRDLPATRGKIYFSEKDILTNDWERSYPVSLNIEKYDLNAIPRNIKDPQKIASQLSQALNRQEDELFNLINNSKPYIPPIAKSISKEEADKIKDLKLGGIFLTHTSSRMYPENSLASQVIGFVNAEGHGQYGIEGTFNDLLTGKSGTLYGSKDTKGRLIDLSGIEESENGSDILLTMDHNIQFMAEKKLKEGIDRYQCESGTIIVMDPKTGAILAMTSKPDYNPNEFGKIAAENQSLFINPAVSGLYEPGSTIKSLVMAAAIEKGVVNSDTKENFTKEVTIGEYTIGTAEDKAFGWETMTDVLVHSDNVAMVWLAGKLGKDDMYEYVKKFGLGDKTNIELSNEESGVVRDKKKWRDINLATISFGQGISATPLQMLSAYQALSNGGKLMQPYIIEAVRESNGEITETKPKELKQVVSSETANKITAMLIEVVDRGTGRHAKVKGYKTAAKTGTAQVPNPEGGYFGEDIKIGSLIGYSPAEDPKFVMIVKLDKPKLAKWGETSAGPIFGEMNEWLLNYYEVRPTEEIKTEEPKQESAEPTTPESN